MSRETLATQSRTEVGSEFARRMRRSGQVPGVLYRKDASYSFVADEREVKAIMRHGATLVDVTIDGTPHTSVIKDYQAHPVKGHLLHIDFQEVRMDETVNITVLLHPVGEAAGVKTGGGILNQLLHEVEAEAMPGDIPEFIEYDVSHLEIGDQLNVGDLKVPEGVTILSEGDVGIASVTPPTVAEVEVSPEEAAAAEGAASGEASGGDAPAADGQ